MAEFIMKNYINKEHLNISCASYATSTEEIGNDLYYLAKSTLDKYNIPYSIHHATRFNQRLYDEFDLFFVMDENNYYNLRYLINDMSKVKFLKEYYPNHKDLEIADPWYTRNFDLTYHEINESIKNLILSLKEKKLC